MANPNMPFGFRPSRHIAGGTPGRTNGFSIASGYGTTIYLGDPVTRDGNDGIIRAAANTSILGIFVGVNIIGPDGSVVFSPKWTAGQTLATGFKAEALVIDDEFQTFIVQSSGSLDDASVGNLVNVDFATAGDDASGQSRAAVSTALSTENQFLVERILEVPVTNTDKMPAMSERGQYAIVEVSIARSARGVARVVPASTEI